MSLLIDVKYVSLISSRFERIVKKKDYLWNLRCPICGDSKKNSTKMRGYIYRKINDLFYSCHNCGIGLSIGNFIRSLDDGLYKQYIFERYSAGEGGRNNFKTSEVTENFQSFKFETKKKLRCFQHGELVSDLPDAHFCKQYVLSRKIPERIHDKLYFTSKFKSFVEELYPEIDKKLSEDERLVIPIFDKYNDIVGVYGRALSFHNGLRYIKLNFGDSRILYNEFEVDASSTVRVVEGAIDSMFVKNCVASGDSSLEIAAKRFEKSVLLFDNEPRNKQIVKLMENSIRNGHSIVIWPDTIKEKDINEMIISGKTEQDIENIINENSFSGLEANLKFISWRKC